MPQYAADTSVSKGCLATRRYRARKKAVEQAITQRERQSRTQPTERELAWAAGLFEGEGTVSIRSSGRFGYTRPLVSVTSTDLEIVTFFHERWPGSLHTFRPKGNAKEATTWTLNACEAIWRFLDDVYGYLRTTSERTKFAVVMADIEARVQGSHDSAYRKACQERARIIRRLNHRGTTPMPPLLEKF